MMPSIARLLPLRQKASGRESREARGDGEPRNERAAASGLVRLARSNSVSSSRRTSSTGSRAACPATAASRTASPGPDERRGPGKGPAVDLLARGSARARSSEARPRSPRSRARDACARSPRLAGGRLSGRRSAAPLPLERRDLRLERRICLADRARPASVFAQRREAARVRLPADACADAPLVQGHEASVMRARVQANSSGSRPTRPRRVRVGPPLGRAPDLQVQVDVRARSAARPPGARRRPPREAGTGRAREPAGRSAAGVRRHARDRSEGRAAVARARIRRHRTESYRAGSAAPESVSRQRPSRPRRRFV